MIHNKSGCLNEDSCKNKDRLQDKDEVYLNIKNLFGSFGLICLVFYAWFWSVPWFGLVALVWFSLFDVVFIFDVVLKGAVVLGHLW